MATITRIEAIKRNTRFRIIFDFDWKMEINRETLLTFQLREGMQLDPVEIREIQNFNEKALLKEQAFRYLKQRAHSRMELKRKLIRKGFQEDLIEKLLQELEEVGMLNENDFIHMFVHDRVRFTKKGSYAIVQELKRKGFSEEVAKSVVREYLSEEEELEQAKLLAEKKWHFYRNKPEADRKQKVYQYLIQKGYPPYIVMKAIRMYLNDDELTSEDV